MISCRQSKNQSITINLHQQTRRQTRPRQPTSPIILPSTKRIIHRSFNPTGHLDMHMHQTPSCPRRCNIPHAARLQMPHVPVRPGTTAGHPIIQSDLNCLDNQPLRRSPSWGTLVSNAIPRLAPIQKVPGPRPGTFFFFYEFESCSASQPSACLRMGTRILLGLLERHPSHPSYPLGPAVITNRIQCVGTRQPCLVDYGCCPGFEGGEGVPVGTAANAALQSPTILYSPGMLLAA